MAGEGGGGPVTGIAHVGMRFTGILLEWVAPIGAFIAGYFAGDVFGLAGMIDGFLPNWAGNNQFVSVPNLLAGAVYFLLAFLLGRLIPFIGRIVFGAFAGLGVNRLLAAMKGPLAQVKPKNAASA